MVGTKNLVSQLLKKLGDLKGEREKNRTQKGKGYDKIPDLGRGGRDDHGRGGFKKGEKRQTLTEKGSGVEGLGML